MSEIIRRYDQRFADRFRPGEGKDMVTKKEMSMCHFFLREYDSNVIFSLVAERGEWFALRSAPPLFVS